MQSLHSQSIIEHAEKIQIDFSTPPQFLFKKETIQKLIEINELASIKNTPLVCSAVFPSDQNMRIHFSVFDGSNIKHPLNRIRVTYDTKKNDWRCARCNQKKKFQCNHKAIAKWTYYVKYQALSDENDVEDSECDIQGVEEEDKESSVSNEMENKIKRILDYQFKFKTIPHDIPHRYIQKGKEAKFPISFTPSEKFCVYCNKKLEYFGIITGIITEKVLWYNYRKSAIAAI